ncbi:ribonuclease III domain-containing protein [Anabaena catenula]|uniref:Ribonuclease 3 n=1 Tax=Anabaena catenula FACHB-362 TaxID=2692877 RepID=A0ABR8J1H2_9NOST|nr:ribonuclease III domain-containing protein [Anabaena catenula]MBD2692166.1 hypothetical protein [Anabaena catenula FACHB-362]
MSINIDSVKQVIGIPDFQKTELLESALTHPSRIYETNKNQQQKDQQEREYRRLAILGDSLLGAIVVDYLHGSFSELNQGYITDIKCQIVSREKCYKFARKLKLSDLCLLGRSAQQKDECQQKDLFGEMFEALLGAIYIEYGRNFKLLSNWLIERFIKQTVDEIMTDNQYTENQSSEDYLSIISSMNTEESADFLRQKKVEADALVAQDEKLQQLLIWIQKKSSLVNSDQPTKVRAFYLSLIRILGRGFVSNFDPNINSNSKVRQFFLGFTNRATDIGLDLAFKYNTNHDSANVLASIFTINFEPELQQALRKLQAELPNPKTDKEAFDVWRETHGQDWLKKVIKLIDYDLEFSKDQKTILNQYYKANQGILDCLNNSETKISPESKREIEESLLLPIT